MKVEVGRRAPVNGFLIAASEISTTSTGLRRYLPNNTVFYPLLGNISVRFVMKRSSKAHVQSANGTGFLPLDDEDQAPILPSESDELKRKKYARLHDFCMCIPYGVLLTATGMLLSLFGSGLWSWVLCLVGIAQLGLSKMSLQKWKERSSSQSITGISCALAFLMAWKSWEMMQSGGSFLLHGILLVLHAAAALFFLYNIVAGGNPPPQGVVANE